MLKNYLKEYYLIYEEGIIEFYYFVIFDELINLSNDYYRERE